MAVDISTDLNITLLARDIATPTNNGLYDVGSPPGTYVPGKDFSPIDDVSTGTTAQLNFSIAFDSVSNQLYGLDRVFIQSVDDPRADGAGAIPGRWINQNPDPTDITDDGLNVIISNYNAQMSSIVFDETANIQSDSTVTTGISAALPNGFWWKSKIMPKIQVVAVKDGIQKVSAPLQLPTVRLSTAGALVSTLNSNGVINYTVFNGRKGFFVPVSIITSKFSVPNVTRMLDEPSFDLITYEVDFAAAVNGQNIPLTTADFFGNPSGGTLVSLSYAAGVLTAVIRQNNPSALSFSFNAFLPFDAGSADEATVTVTGGWHTVPPTITDFMNRYLFTESATGSISREVVVDTSGQPPEPPLTIENNIFGSLASKSVAQNVRITNYPCFQTLNSTFLRMIDSEISSFGPNIQPLYSYTRTDGTPGGGVLPAGAYQLLYGHYDFPAGYDPNLVAQLVVTGAIPLLPYADLIATGQTANILRLVVTRDLFAGQGANPLLPIFFSFNGDLTVLTQAQFAALYAANPKAGYPTYLYNYMSLGTCYPTVADAVAAVGGLLSGVDSFTLRNGRVFLNLGATAKGQSLTVGRFNGTSTVQALLPLDTIEATIQYIITAMGSEVPVTVVTDYTQEYCLFFRWGVISGAENAFSNVPADTVFTVTLPDNLRPYLYLSGQPYIQMPLNGGPPVQVPITEYHLSGNTLTFTTPIELNFRPDSVCVPVKFLTPSNDVATGFTSLTFSKPLVYNADPNSLLYGFTTDSLLFRVVTTTQGFTLKGAQIDTTGLSVTPEVYERGQAATYIATVYNQSYSPSSDYCMAIAVPTNQYNPVESSNNTLPAFITDINPTDPRTVIYFQTAANATAMDISMMKTLNRPGGPTLRQYFDTVVVNDWVRYAGQVLPTDVVMLVGCTDGVVQNSQVRIDYDVVVQVPPGSNTLFTNDAVFNYYSSGANLEAQSNMVTIRNRIAEAIPIVKTPPVQIHPLENGEPVNFTLYFTAPADPLIFKTFTITDVLHPSIRLNAVGGVAAVTPPGTAVPFTSSVDPSDNTLTVTIANSPAIAGKLVLVNLAATVADASLIPFDPAVQLPAFRNTAVLTINNNPELIARSNTVIAAFQPPPLRPVPIVKAPATQTKPKVSGTAVAFTLGFTAPALYNVYTSFTVTDTLHPALALDVPGVAVTADGSPIAAAVNYQPATNTVTVSFANSAASAGRDIVITLPTTVADVDLIPANNLITNSARLTLNNNAQLYSDSNTVEVRFTGVPVPPERCQAITDLIESTAMEQTALAHILNAEGEKLQKALSMPLTVAQTLEFNKSVTSMVESISMLESILKRKLSLVDCGLCEPCSADPQEES